MKRLISILSAISMALVLLLAMDQTALTTKAAGTTYVLRWDSSKNTWAYQPGSKWDDASHSTREKYYLDKELKDGDLIVIDDNAPITDNVLTFNAHLANVTVTNDKTVVVNANGIDDFYALDGSAVSVNSEILRAHIYDKASVTLNDNVDYLEILVTGNNLYEFKANVAATKKVAEMETHSAKSNKYHIINVESGKFELYNGLLYTDKKYYQEYGDAEIVKVTSLSSSSSSSATANTPKKDSEYDSVPKTGTDYTLAIVLLGFGVLFLGAQFVFKKTRRA